ncbi:hypothetical protein Esti_004010 [Eimeria stiedai]
MPVFEHGGGTPAAAKSSNGTNGAGAGLLGASGDPQQQPHHHHHHHTSVKKTPAATIRQDARQAALLNVRKAQREKVMAFKRVEMRPPDVPPQPQPLTPLLLTLHDLLQQQQQQQQHQVLQQQCDVLQQLCSLMCNYPFLLDALAEQQETANGTSAAAVAAGAAGGGRAAAAASQCDAYAILAAALQQNLPMYVLCSSRSSTGGDQQLPQLLLKSLTNACACLAELALAAPVDEQTVQHVVPVLLQLLDAPQQQQQQQGELQQQQQQLECRAAYALANVAATWPATCADLGACKPALHLLQQSERQFAAAYAEKQQQQQQKAEEECLAAVRSVTIAARLCGNLQRHIPDSGVAAAAADVALLAARIAVLESILRIELQQQQALLLLSSGDARRACVAEVLWCLHAEVRALLLFSQHEQQQQQQQQECGSEFCSAAAAAVGAACPTLASTLLKVVEEALQGAARARQPPHLLQQEQQQEQQQLLQQRDPDAFLRERLDKTGADGLVPALQCLAVLCDSRRVSRMWASDLTGPQGPLLLSLLQHLLRNDDHRGVLQAALSVVTSLAAGPPQSEKAVSSLLPLVVSILSSASSFDIKREAAEAVLHLAFNNDAMYLREVLAAEPDVLSSLLDMIEHCKYDLASVLICLDFFAEVLEREPRTRAHVQAMDGIARIESVQFVHSEAVDKRVSWLISRYFDGLSDEENEEPSAAAAAASTSPPVAAACNSFHAAS